MFYLPDVLHNRVGNNIHSRYCCKTQCNISTMRRLHKCHYRQCDKTYQTYRTYRLEYEQMSFYKAEMPRCNYTDCIKQKITTKVI